MSQEPQEQEFPTPKAPDQAHQTGAEGRGLGREEETEARKTEAPRSSLGSALSPQDLIRSQDAVGPQMATAEFIGRDADMRVGQCTAGSGGQNREVGSCGHLKAAGQPSHSARTQAESGSCPHVASPQCTPPPPSLRGEWDPPLSVDPKK